MSRQAVPIQQIARIIRVIRGEKVLLDVDLAPLYGVTPGNRAMRRNRGRCPSDFMFQLTVAEAESLIFQFGRAKGRGGRRHRPYAFTEQGVAMLSSLWTGRRTRLACNRQSGSDRWRPRHREVFQPLLLDKFEIQLKESFSAGRRKEHARRVCSPDWRA